MQIEFTAEELQEIIGLCSYALSTGLDTDEVWANEELYQSHLQTVERVKGIRQKARDILEPKTNLSDLYPYYSARQLNGCWYPVASFDGTNWVSPFERTFSQFHAMQAVEKEDVLQWIRNNGGKVFG